MKRFFQSGDPFVWLAGGTLAIALLMVVGLVALILRNGLGFFWPAAVHQFDLRDGGVVVGEITGRESLPDGSAERIQVKRGNRDVYGSDFVWIPEPEIEGRSVPERITVVERLEWGDLYGTLIAVKDGDQVVASAPDPVWDAYDRLLAETREIQGRIHDLEAEDIGVINDEQESIRLEVRELELGGVTSGPRIEALSERMAELDRAYETKLAELRELRTHLDASAVFEVAGHEDPVEEPLSQIVRAYQPNAMGLWSKGGFYAAKAWEFVSTNPRESNTEGGVFPAIFGTVMMVLLMSVVVAPLGVVAAVYLREYAAQGTLVSVVRIAVYNLAGVPSIVFGVFGVGFFIYTIGGTIDQLFFPESLPTPTFGTGGILWASLTLALLTVPAVIVAVEEGLAAIPRGTREASLALGATKFETTWRVVLPAVTPAILTGLILAIARAAGEVAPLMITGVVKLAPELPLDGNPPFLHLERKFMHLGFHIYDVGFQSPNVDAARPMVYTTTLLLLLIVLLLNLAAVVLRNRLRKRYAVSGI